MIWNEQHACIIHVQRAPPLIISFSKWIDVCYIYTNPCWPGFATFARDKKKTSSRPSSKTLGKFVESYSPILFTTGEIKVNLNSFHLNSIPIYLPRLLLLCIRNEANQANAPTFFLCVCVYRFLVPSFSIVGLFLDLIYSEEVNYWFASWFTFPWTMWGMYRTVTQKNNKQTVWLTLLAISFELTFPVCVCVFGFVFSVFCCCSCRPLILHVLHQQLCPKFAWHRGYNRVGLEMTAWWNATLLECLSLK